MKLSVVLVLYVAVSSATLAVAAAARVPRDAQEVEEASQSIEEILAGGPEEAGDEEEECVDIFHNVTRKEFEDYPDENEDEYYEGEEDEDEEDEDEDAEAPYKKLGKWIKGWPQQPLYIIIVGGYCLC